jgi:conjugal transfer pilus assembly protein TraE
MNFKIYNKRLGHLYIQRNFLAGLSGLLLVIALSQSIFLFFKKERIIINPPELRQSYWIEGDRFSRSYLEEMALFFSHLLLDVSESNILPQGEILLRYIEPEAYGTFKKKLLADEKRLRKQQLSLHFTAKSVECVEPLVLDVQGVLSNYVASKKISQFQETYRIVFSQKKGRLFLESFDMIKSDQKSEREDA